MTTKNHFSGLKTGSFSALEGIAFEQIGFYERRGIMFTYGRLGCCWFWFLFFLN